MGLAERDEFLTRLRGQRKSAQDNSASLTGRELDILKLLDERLQNKKITTRLFISTNTVDHHLSSIFFKLEANSTIKAVQMGRKVGVLGRVLTTSASILEACCRKPAKCFNHLNLRIKFPAIIAAHHPLSKQ